MRRKRLLWQLYPSYVLITLVSLIAATWYGSRVMRRVYLEGVVRDLEVRARFIGRQLSEQFVLAGSEMRAAHGRADLICKEVGAATSTRITAILPSGTVIGDTDEDPARMDNHADRPEVMEALAGRVGSSTRYSHTVRMNMMYVAVPVLVDGRVAGVVRTSLPVESIDLLLREVRVRIALGGLVIAALAALVSLFVSRRISRPLEVMRHGAARFAEGDLERRFPVPPIEEIGGLAEAMNHMAAQLDERMRTLVRERNEQEAVLSSMVEGVIAVDAGERVLNVNLAAARLVGINLLTAQGRLIQEVVRNTDLQQFVKKTLASREPVEGDLLILPDNRHGENRDQRSIQAHGTVLRGAEGQSIGALVVLNDVTRLRRLEDIRREFVANVSHELKTPITSIKGFVETLLDGAINSPEDAQRFLTIISAHADRLHAIVEDLLTLSRIEQESERKEIALEANEVSHTLRAAIQCCLVKAEEKRIRIDLECADDLRAKMDRPLLEQAVVNLIDNALKYSEPGSVVEVAGFRSGSEVLIQVRDQGCGIEKEHLPRIFERFYRVDKARSRKLGGTGLGLAIVKHIAQAHAGRVTVESTPGKGSVFTIHLLPV